MAYHRRYTRRVARRSKNNFIVTLILIGFLIYATLQWILPALITGIGVVTNIVKPSSKKITSVTENTSLPPPVLNIPYEATNTAQINIPGYGTPNSKVAIYLDDDKKDTVNVSSDGSFVFKNISLVLGTNNVYCKSLDSATGRAGDEQSSLTDKNTESLPSKTFKIIYDNEKPQLNLNEPEDNKKIQGGDKKVKISGKTEPGVQLFINDRQTIVDNAGNFSSDQNINDGDNNFNIKAVDSASNTNEVSRRVTYQP